MAPLDSAPNAEPRPHASDSAAPTAAFDLNGAEVALDHAGALWWPAERTLVVSDLHLEKGSAYAARGVPLPPYDTRATLQALEAVIAAHRPRTVISLGDSFHDAACEARMDGADLERLVAVVASVADWIWIEGNHDPAPPDHVGGTVMADVTMGPLIFRHEPTPGQADGEVAGHLHPCARVVRRGRSVRRRCFATDGARLVMPAFGAFTGGLNVLNDAFAPLFQASPPIAHMLGKDRVWPVQARRLFPD